MSCNSCGINDCRNIVTVLAKRIFDNVRIDEEAEPFSLALAQPLPEDATPLYVSGTGEFDNAQTMLSSAPLNGEYTLLSGTISVPCTLVYSLADANYSLPCSLGLPVSVSLLMPSSALMPCSCTLHYSFLSSSVQADAGACIADGTFILYSVATMPVCLPYSGEITYNGLEEKGVSAQSDLLSCDFYPTSPLSPPSYTI